MFIGINNMRKQILTFLITSEVHLVEFRKSREIYALI